MATEPELRTIQTWLQAFIVEPGERDHALGVAAEEAGLEPDCAEQLILPSPTLKPAERLQIYRDMYLVRMEESMAMDYPGIKSLLGEQEFWNLTAHYVQVFPSQSYNIDDLGQHLPQYLEQFPRQPEAFLLDMARLERAIRVVFNEDVCDKMLPGDLPRDLAKAQLTPIPAFRLVQVDHPVNSYLQALYTEQERPAIGPGVEYVAVWRHEFEVWRQALHPAIFIFLSGLAQGQTVSQAMMAILRHRQYRREISQKDLFDWVKAWTQQGVFRATSP